jgi:hypothetical protein
MRCGERVRLDSRFSAWLAWKHRRCGGVFAPDPELAGLGSATIHPAGQPTGVDYNTALLFAQSGKTASQHASPVWRRLYGPRIWLC